MIKLDICSLRQYTNNLIISKQQIFQWEMSNSNLNINGKNGLRNRSVNIENILDLKNISTYGKPKGNQLLTRTYLLHKYIQKCKEEELWMYNRRMLTGPSTEVLAMDQNNNILYGINFASADYLGLSQNQSAKEAAILAANNNGISSGGPPYHYGANRNLQQLKQDLANFWDCKGLTIYSAGWLAGYGAIKALVGPNDFVIMDQLSHNCLQQGANSATKKVIKFPHLSHSDLVAALTKTRQENPEAGILVVTEGLFSMDSDTPDLNLTQQLCKRLNAFLLIDCAHDFGCMGKQGKGNWEVQKLRDRSNVILIGTGSKCLSTNIGFVGCSNLKVIEHIENVSASYLHTTALNPIQCATSLANLQILKSESGKIMRAKVMENYHYLRGELQAKGFKIFGNPCPILPLFVGNEVVCRLVSRLMMDEGVHVNGIQFPVVKIGQARLRVNLMPQHTKQHLDTFVRVFQTSLAEANIIFQREMAKYLANIKQTQPKL